MKSRTDKTKYNFIIDDYNNKIWYKNNKPHREKDLPAVIYDNGNMFWFKNGERHRDRNLPAVIYNNGYCGWYVNGGYLRHSLPE